LISFYPEELDAARWLDLSTQSSCLNLLQTWEYGEAKKHTSPWKVERGILRRGDTPIGVAQVFLRTLPLGLGGLAWINRGPISVEPGKNETACFTAFSAALISHYVKDRGLYLRMAPPLDVDTISPDMIEAAGLKCADTMGWASARLDLRLPLNEIRAGLHRKWRGHLNRAERSPLTLREGTGPEVLDVFLSDHKNLIEQKGFETSVTPELLQTMQNLLPESQKMLAIIAQDESQHVGSVLIAVYGKTAEYLAGNTSATGRKQGAGQLLLWRAIEILKQRGVETLDVSGMDPIYTPKGILTFKQGLSGTPYRLMNSVYAGDAGIVNRLIHWRVDKALTPHSG
jgi:lipid II:glycine glycyltransferase (peptidoglycan interpeptide bridge formation enzyme)